VNSVEKQFFGQKQSSQKQINESEY